MMEMQLIMGDDKLRSISKERWVSQIPAIISQAQVEAPHRTRISDMLSKDEGNQLHNVATSYNACMIADIGMEVNNSLLALAILPLLLPDARSKADPDKVIYFTEVFYS